MNIRPAIEEDLVAINELYNHYIATSHATFDIDPWPLATRKDWFAHYSLEGRHRLFVAVVDGAVAGYASSSRFRPKQAYETSVETSVYCGASWTGRGVGRALYEALFAALETCDVHRAYAGISLPNDASIALHERFGFKQVALFTEQGRKFGRYWDVAWFERGVSGAA